jgi:hypothetical protein
VQHLARPRFCFVSTSRHRSDFMCARQKLVSRRRGGRLSASSAPPLFPASVGQLVHVLPTKAGVLRMCYPTTWVATAQEQSR